MVRAKNVPSEVHRGTNFVGLRCIDHPFVTKLLELVREPITTTSINISGQAPSTNPKQLLNSFPDNVYCVDEDVRLMGDPSKVIKLTDKKIVLRN